MNYIYLKENHKQLCEPDQKETTTLLIFNGLMLFIGIAVIAFFTFLSILATDAQDVDYFGLTTVIAIGIGLFLYLICVNVYFSWQLIKLLRQS